LPVAVFSADVTEAIAGEQAVTFTDASTPAGEIVAWHWDFGDGKTEDWDILSRPLSGKTSHLYADGGTYTVSLTVTDTSDTSDAESKTAYVVVHAKPRSVFASVKTAKAKQEITFTDSSTGDITQWVWDFGDGTSEQWTTATRPADGKVEHAFKKKGTYIVSLEVVGPLGSDTKNTQIEVSGAGGFHFGLWMIGVAVAVIVVIAAGVYLLRARRAK
jgi:PKD repeat protein